MYNLQRKIYDETRQMLEEAGYKQIATCHDQWEQPFYTMEFGGIKKDTQRYCCDCTLYEKDYEFIVIHDFGDKVIKSCFAYDEMKMFNEDFCWGRISENFKPYIFRPIEEIPFSEFRDYLKSTRGVENSGNSAVL